jgi:hypothetical protein
VLEEASAAAVAAALRNAVTPGPEHLMNFLSETAALSDLASTHPIMGDAGSRNSTTALAYAFSSGPRVAST